MIPQVTDDDFETAPLSLDFEAIVKLSDGFNGADLRNVCTEAGRTSAPIWSAPVAPLPRWRLWSGGASGPVTPALVFFRPVCHPL